METVKLITFGRGGDTAHFSLVCIAQGYGTPERPHATRPREGRITPVGTPVIDMRPAVGTPEGYRHAILGPMVDVDQVRRVNLAKIDVFDTVGIDQFIEGWRSHGARIGVVSRVDDAAGELEISWEEAASEPTAEQGKLDL